MSIPFQSVPCDQGFDCAPVCGALPDVTFSLCNPKVYVGDVQKVYLSAPNQPLIERLDANEWASRIALPSSNPAKITRLYCTGSKAVPEREEIEGAYGVKGYAFKHHRMDFSFMQLDDTNYNFMRYIERWKKATAWYSTAGGKTYGGTGLQVKVYLDQVIPEKASAFESITGWIEWEYRIHPCRDSSVI